VSNHSLKRFFILMKLSAHHAERLIDELGDIGRNNVLLTSGRLS